MKKISFISATVMLLCFSVAALGGCFFSCSTLSGLSFEPQTIKIVVGQQINLYDYLKVTPSGQEANASFNSGDTNTVQISGYSAIGMDEGSAKITAEASGIKTTCTIEVSYSEISKVTIYTDGDLIQSAGEEKPVEFTAVTDDFADSGRSIAWYVGGELLGSGSTFGFQPNGSSAVYPVKAVSSGDAEISDTAEIRVYKPFITEPGISASGAFIQSETNAVPVNFELDYAAASGDPYPVVEWFINGVSVLIDKAGGTEFDFYQTAAGKYTFTAKVNGSPVKIDGAYEKDLIVGGKAVPQNVSIDFDTNYPNIIISWDNDLEMNHKVIITSGSNSTEYDALDYAEKFSGNTFNAVGLIDLKSTYSIGVKSMGDGGHFTESDYVYINTAKLAARAITYLEKKYTGGNYYITSDEEFYDIYAYVMLFRPNSKATSYNGQKAVYTNMEVYMGYDSEHSALQLSRLAWEYSSQAGEYLLDNPVGNARTGSVLSVKITYLTDNTPSKSTSTRSRNRVLLKPHIDYTASLRADSFPIDEKPLSADSAGTSDELYYVVNKGYRPNIKPGSDAETLYDYARETLRDIIGENMTELDKIHAIYDWIMWRTQYDDDVLNITSLSQSVKYKSYYMDSVLTDSYPYSVCDGLAKTFSLMCNIEGIECIRVTGVAYGAGGFGEHAWNKVKYEGEWYNVDCTWGDYLVGIDSSTYDTGSHQYLMLTDYEIYETHREDVGQFPATSEKPLNIFNFKTEHNGNEIDFLITNSDAGLRYAELQNLVGYILTLAPQSSSYTIGSASGRYNSTNVYYFGADIKISKNLMLSVKADLDQIIPAKTSRQYLFISYGEYLFILFKY